MVTPIYSTNTALLPVSGKVGCVKNDLIMRTDFVKRKGSCFVLFHSPSHDLFYI